jgi:hypothetical protein
MASWFLTICIVNGDQDIKLNGDIELKCNNESLIKKIKDIKLIIQNSRLGLELELDAGRQLLVYNGRILDDNERTLGDYGIVNQSTLFLYLMNEVEVEAKAKADADAERRRIVETCTPHVPDNIIINHKEGCNLMNVLYQVGFLSDFVADLDHDNGIIINEDHEVVEVKLENYFPLNREDYIMIDPKTGRITFLYLDMTYVISNNRVPSIIDPFRSVVPSIIDQFQSLESLHLNNCGLLTMELGNLPLLETMHFFKCTSTMFENIPEGLQLSSIKEVRFNSDSNSFTFKSNLSSFLKIFSNTLEVLEFYCMTREDLNEILHVLQNDDLCFRHSLTTIEMVGSKLNEDDLKRLLFEILGRFPNLHTLNISGNNIESLCGIGDRIGDRIEQDLLKPDNKLRKLIFSNNPIMKQFDEDGGPKNPKEIEALTEALVTLLDEFNGISSLGYYTPLHQKYVPEIEYKLRINLAGRKELMDRPIMNRALWPLILKRANSNSSEIYLYLRNGKDTVTINQEVESKKCASGLFYLLKDWKIVDGSSRTTTTTTTTNITNDNSSEGSNINNNNNNNTRNE